MAVEVLKTHFAGRKALHHRSDGELIPVALEIEGRPHLVTRLANDGSAVADFDGHVERGQIIQTTLLVGCDGFDVSVPALWEVVDHVPERHELSLKLAPVNEATHLATINTLIDAIVDGELITARDTLEIAKVSEADRIRTQEREEAKPASPVRQAVKRRAGSIAFLLIAALLLAFITANLAGRAFVVEADGTIVNSRSVIPVMPEDAELVAFTAQPGARVRANDPVAIVKSKGGQMLTVASPCDCVVGGHLASSRAFLRKGEAVAQLVPADGANRALLSVKLDELRRIKVGDEATLRFYDSDAKVVGTVERVSPPKVLGNAPARPRSLNGTVEVRFASKLPAWRVGEPVAARVLLSRLNPFA